MEVVADREWCRRENAGLLRFTKPLIGRRLSCDDVDLDEPDGGGIERERSPDSIRLPIQGVERIVEIELVPALATDSHPQAFQKTVPAFGSYTITPADAIGHSLPRNKPVGHANAFGL